MHLAFTSLSVLATAATVIACNAYNKGLPVATGTVTLSKVQTIAAGQTFDCGWKKYGGLQLYLLGVVLVAKTRFSSCLDRGSGACNDQVEGGDADAVFLLQSGATLQNCIIGKNQAEGVHCNGRTCHCLIFSNSILTCVSLACTLNFVWVRILLWRFITTQPKTSFIP